MEILKTVIIVFGLLLCLVGALTNNPPIQKPDDQPKEDSTEP